MWFYLNGRFVEDAEATVPVTDHSFLYGDGCFEGIGVCNGRVLHLDEHVERMFKSARMLRIAMPVSNPMQFTRAHSSSVRRPSCTTSSSKPRPATEWPKARWDICGRW